MIKQISFYKKPFDIESTDTIPLDIFLENIRTGVYEDHVHPIRLMEYGSKQMVAAKKMLPSVTISGVFHKREDDKIKDHSGYIAIDIDPDGFPEGITAPDDLKSFVCADKYVAAAFTSVSGRGLCLLLRINPDKHRDAFVGISEYLLSNYKIVVDSSGINPSRARFVSYDPFIFINTGTVPKFTDYPKIREPKKFENIVFTSDDFSEILNQIVTHQINITQDSYFVWLRLGFALVSKFGESGRQYYHIISQFSSKYDPAVTDKQYNNCIRHKTSRREITISSFYHYARESGVTIYSERTRRIAYAASQGKKSGLNTKQVVENLGKFDDISGGDVLGAVEQVMHQNVTVDDETLIDQIEMFIRHHYQLKRNEITRFIENNGALIQQKDLNTIFIRIKKLFPKCSYELMERLIYSDFIPSYNPFMDFYRKHGGDEYMKRYRDHAPDHPKTHTEPITEPGGITAPIIHPPGVGGVLAVLGTVPDVPRPGTPEFATMYPTIHALFATIKSTDPIFVEYFGTKWLVGIISATHGDHSPLVFVLAGEKQNTGKTEWFRRLLPSELKYYYAESKLDEGKDDRILMTQKLIVMDDEMSGKSKQEAAKLKDLTSKDVFSLREPYGKHNVDLKRLAVLCGTTNILEILHDTTGNRRFIPIYVESIDHRAYNKIDKTELFMEAYRLYKSGFEWRLNADDIKYLGTDGDAFEVVTSELELIMKYFKSGGVNELTASDVKVYIERRTNQRLSLDRIGKELKRLGFPQKHVRVGGGTKRVYQMEYADVPDHTSPRAGVSWWDESKPERPDDEIKTPGKSPGGVPF